MSVGQSLEELARARRPAGRRRRRPAARRSRRARRCGGSGALERAAARLRLVQPDDARRQREGARARLRLRARARDAGRHVPAHAARRGGLAAHARGPVAVAGRAYSASALGARCLSVAPEQVGVHERGSRADSSGSAGRPTTSKADRQDERQPRARHRRARSADAQPKRAGGARNSAKKSTSGGPRFAVASSPGTRNATDDVVEHPGCSSTTCSVGPRQTESASTQRDHDGDERDPRTDSKNARNQKPSECQRDELRDVASAPRSARREQRPPARRTRRRASDAARALARERQREPDDARTSPGSGRARASATSHQRPAFESAPAVRARTAPSAAGSAASAPRALSRAAARPTRGRPP